MVVEVVVGVVVVVMEVVATMLTLEIAVTCWMNSVHVKHR